MKYCDGRHKMNVLWIFRVTAVTLNEPLMALRDSRHIEIDTWAARTGSSFVAAGELVVRTPRRHGAVGLERVRRMSALKRYQGDDS